MDVLLDTIMGTAQSNASSYHDQCIFEEHIESQMEKYPFCMSCWERLRLPEDEEGCKPYTCFKCLAAWEEASEVEALILHFKNKIKYLSRHKC